MVDRKLLDEEINANYAAFKEKLPELLTNNKGKYALFRKKEIIGIYDTVRDAQMTANKFYEDGLFSIQKIEQGAIDLGYFSHAMHLG